MCVSMDLRSLQKRGLAGVIHLTPPSSSSITLGAAVLAGSLLPVTLVRADQPNMQSALSQLPAAKASLEAASRNKRGQRENALRLINQNRGGPAGH
jgi:hypothetical protein